jgi:hypothetical protein
MARSPFDATPQLARYLHARSCGSLHNFDLADCPVARTAAISLVSDFRHLGLTILPENAANFVLRHLEEMSAPSSALEPAPDAPVGLTAFLYTEMVRIRRRRYDDTFSYTDSMVRPIAEMVLIDYNLSHADDVVGAMIEADPAWIGDLFESLGRNYAGFLS